MSPEERQRRAAYLRSLGDEFLDAGARGIEASAYDLFHWHAERERYRASYRAFFRDWDVLLTPMTIVPAFEHRTEKDPFAAEPTLTINGTSVPYIRQVVYPAVATLSGQTATAFPVGLTRAGLPIGLQAIGPYLEDRTAIRFAGLVAREVGGFRRPPAYDD